MTSASQGGLPTFVGLGVLKAGTTLLHGWLADHPEISMPRDRKEVDFFSQYFDRGLGWYVDLFQTGDVKARGEFSVSYLHDPVALDRLATTLPEARCLVSLRDPMTRLASQYRHYAMHSGYRGTLADFVVAHPNAVSLSLYAPQLRSLFDRVDRERVKVLVFESFTRDPESEARSLFSFLGVDPDFRPPSLHERANETKSVRWAPLVRGRERVKDFALRHDLSWVMRAGRRLDLSRLMFAPLEERPAGTRADLAGVEHLRDRFSADVEETSALIGVDVTRYWGPGQAEAR